MRTGDHVLHKPSGEKWVVAYVDDDLQGIARRVANNAISSAEASDKAAVYCAHLFRDHIYNEALAMLRTVALHERQRAGRDTSTLVPTHYNERQ